MEEPTVPATGPMVFRGDPCYILQPARREAPGGSCLPKNWIAGVLGRCDHDSWVYGREALCIEARARCDAPLEGAGYPLGQPIIPNEIPDLLR